MRHHLLLNTACSAAFLVAFPALDAQGQVIAGSDPAGPTGPAILVDYDPFGDHYVLDVDLFFDPAAGPMTKIFDSPIGPTTLPVIFPGQTFPVWENFHLMPGSFPVSDWHEEILTPGWEWVIPPQNAVTSLITKNGDPWPWQHQPHPGGNDPHDAVGRIPADRSAQRLGCA